MVLLTSYRINKSQLLITTGSNQSVSNTVGSSSTKKSNLKHFVTQNGKLKHLSKVKNRAMSDKRALPKTNYYGSNETPSVYSTNNRYESLSVSDKEYSPEVKNLSILSHVFIL